MADKTRFEIPKKAAHPLGWACENCFHVVKDTTPGSKAMKCCAHPPQAQFIQQGIISVSPPVQYGEWCGEYKADGKTVLNA